PVTATTPAYTPPPGRTGSVTIVLIAHDGQAANADSAPTAFTLKIPAAAPEIVSLTVPSVPLHGCVPIEYAVLERSAARVDVLVEVDPDGPGPLPAIRATQGAS